MTISLSSTPFQSTQRRNASWTPETSPTLSDSSSDSADNESEHLPPAPSDKMLASPPLASGSSRLSLPPTTSSSLSTSSGPSMHPYRPQPTRTPSISPPKSNLPKSQPLSRALFARMAMAEIPHAGIANGGSVGKKAAGGKQKMIVATKPMRTTFELGLTSSELARRQ